MNAGYEFHRKPKPISTKSGNTSPRITSARPDRVAADINQTLESLVAFPHQGHRRPDLTNRPLRFIRVREYLIAYAPDKKPLWVIAVNGAVVEQNCPNGSKPEKGRAPHQF